jgi:nucleoid-associated protein YejK
LNNNQLSGFIPKSLEKLQQLQRFDISNNQLTGMFPAFLNNLNQRVSFDFSGNEIIVGTAICPNVADIPQSECNALVHLYNNTDGKNWKITPAGM